MLFVLGIYLLSGRARSVLWQVSAFTVAHSITLGLSMYGVVAVSPRIVEPMIALSIAYVAIENIFLSELKSWRVALVFAFGLLHGMGFAGALKELGLPRSEFVTALLTFNVGVEAGQLAVIGAPLHARRMALRPSRLVPQPHRRSRVGADRVYGGLLDDLFLSAPFSPNLPGRAAWGANHPRAEGRVENPIGVAHLFGLENGSSSMRGPPTCLSIDLLRPLPRPKALASAQDADRKAEHPIIYLCRGVSSSSIFGR